MDLNILIRTMIMRDGAITLRAGSPASWPTRSPSAELQETRAKAEGMLTGTAIMSEWFVDGERVEHIDPNDRGFRYGDGVFETIAIRDGQPRLLDRHFKRLAAGCTRLGVALANSDTLEADLLTALGDNNRHAASQTLVWWLPQAAVSAAIRDRSI